MTFQSVPNTVEIIAEYAAAGQQIINTFYGHMDTLYSIADVEALANAVDTAISTYVLPTLTTNVSYIATRVRGLNTAIDLEAVANAGAGPGTATGASQANNVTLAVKRSSGLTGRGARGRVYWPTVPSSVVDGAGAVSPTFQAAVLAALDAIDESIVASGFIPVIVHRVAAGVPLAPAVVFTILEWVVVNAVTDSMRRRLPGRGG